jgi:hypothetical protein
LQVAVAVAVGVAVVLVLVDFAQQLLQQVVVVHWKLH